MHEVAIIMSDRDPVNSRPRQFQPGSALGRMGFLRANR